MGDEPCAIIFGATGYVGRHVVASLRALGHRTVAHIRSDSKKRTEWETYFARLGAEVVVGPWTTAFLSETLAKVHPSHVFQLIGTTRRSANEAGDHGDIYDKIDFGLTAILVESLGTLRPRLIYLSSLGADPTARSSYLRARGHAEQRIRDSGSPYTIVRPSFISGSDRDELRVGERIGAVAFDGALAFARAFGLRQIHRRYHSIDGNHLAERLVKVAFDEAMANRVLTLDQTY